MGADELQGDRSGLLEGDGGRGDGVEQAALGVHAPHEVVHGFELGRGGGDHEVGALGHHLQVVVGDQGGHLDDDVAAHVESGHLQIHPHQHAGDATG